MSKLHKQVLPGIVQKERWSALLVLAVLSAVEILSGCTVQHNLSVSTLTEVGNGWAKNSVNTVIFRKNSLVSTESTQYIAYYDPEARLILGQRNLKGSTWHTQETPFQGNARDAHNSISIAVDGDGYLHVSWDHHNTPLRYARSIAPGSLILGEEMIMTGQREQLVSYPEFYRFPDEDLLFFYRDGGSGNGSLVINKYSSANQQWTRLQDMLIDGEGQRNAYWQACVDQDGVIHVSWVWRESPDVASNHDMCYARSLDGGVSWQRSNGEAYELPITESSAEVVCRIPMNSELINQTSMAVSRDGEAYIVSYWKPPGSEVPQYHLVYQNQGEWEVENLGFRSQPFSLSGMGTKKIPISRPQLVLGEKSVVYVIFRDDERGNKVSIAQNVAPFKGEWTLTDLTDGGYGSWEPTLDHSFWVTEGVLSLLLQKNEQVDGEGLSEIGSSVINVLDLKVAHDKKEIK
ncbi:BNR repeat-containing protein [Marinoscillum sp. MHG1-6]|uniref:BNR repeat-containing protein n=1 Tax=Marinoscillum sp. MHG1-6 TaxID=2959627 RepID=UPI0021587BCB|nr:BNR repeat-containing protein [Marinoscillum sp. MHG1-6]